MVGINHSIDPIGGGCEDAAEGCAAATLMYLMVRQLEGCMAKTDRKLVFYPFSTRKRCPLLGTWLAAWSARNPSLVSHNLNSKLATAYKFSPLLHNNTSAASLIHATDSLGRSDFQVILPEFSRKCLAPMPLTFMTGRDQAACPSLNANPSAGSARQPKTINRLRLCERSIVIAFQNMKGALLIYSCSTS